MDSPAPVAVIIVNYNAGALLVDGVAAALPQARQIVVIDNHSTDDSLHRLEARFPSEPRLTVIRAERNLGFAAGCNRGVRAATQGTLMFLNPDCLLGANTLHRLLAVLESDPGIGMVGGLLVNPDGSEQGGGRRALPTPWRSFVRAFGLYRLAPRWPALFFDFHLHTQPLPAQPIEVEAISGALMLVRRAALIDVGPWDEGYFLHCEDLDWCVRFRRNGWKIVFVPDAPVVHRQGACSGSRPIFVEWHKHRGMLRFYRKFFRDRYPGVLMWLVALGVWLRFGIAATRQLVRRVGRGKRQ
ncbi:MAG: glycosyltransferase family 2 protein [Porticoccaceae bacterium]